MEGETLAARLARGALPLEEAIEICLQIATGMEAAHESKQKEGAAVRVGEILKKARK